MTILGILELSVPAAAGQKCASSMDANGKYMPDFAVQAAPAEHRLQSVRPQFPLWEMGIPGLLRDTVVGWSARPTNFAWPQRGLVGRQDQPIGAAPKRG